MTATKFLKYILILSLSMPFCASAQANRIIFRQKREVKAPSGWTWTLPFKIYYQFGKFTIDNGFNLQSYANIPVAKTYYVDNSVGNDNNAGDTWGSGHAFASINKAIVQADVDRVYIKAGYYFYNQSTLNTNITRSVELIGVGGQVYCTTDVYNQVGAFTAVDNHYSATISGRTVGDVWDSQYTDVFGDESCSLVLKASEAEVDATPGSYYRSGTTIYIHTTDSRAPDSKLRYYQSSVYVIKAITDNIKIYCENISAHGSYYPLSIGSASAAGGNKGYFKNCTFRYNHAGHNLITVYGSDETIFQNCKASKGGMDGFNYHAGNGIIPKAIEIDCEAYSTGLANSDQASTIHDGGTIVRINGNYHHTAGANVADVTTDTKSWLLGCIAHDSDYGCGFQMNTTNWLDHCVSYGNSVWDINNSLGSTVYVRSFSGAGINSISGSIFNY
jgi:hypothetical protein